MKRTGVFVSKIVLVLGMDKHKKQKLNVCWQALWCLSIFHQYSPTNIFTCIYHLEINRKHTENQTQSEGSRTRMICETKTQNRSEVFFCKLECTGVFSNLDLLFSEFTWIVREDTSLFVQDKNHNALGSRVRFVAHTVRMTLDFGTLSPPPRIWSQDLYLCSASTATHMPQVAWSPFENPAVGVQFWIWFTPHVDRREKTNRGALLTHNSENSSRPRKCRFLFCWAHRLATQFSAWEKSSVLSGICFVLNKFIDTWIWRRYLTHRIRWSAAAIWAARHNSPTLDPRRETVLVHHIPGSTFMFALGKHNSKAICDLKTSFLNPRRYPQNEFVSKGRCDGRHLWLVTVGCSQSTRPFTTKSRNRLYIGTDSWLGWRIIKQQTDAHLIGRRTSRRRFRFRCRSGCLCCCFLWSRTNLRSAQSGSEPMSLLQD